MNICIYKFIYIYIYIYIYILRENINETQITGLAEDRIRDCHIKQKQIQQYKLIISVGNRGTKVKAP